MKYEAIIYEQHFPVIRTGQESPLFERKLYFKECETEHDARMALMDEVLKLFDKGKLFQRWYVKGNVHIETDYAIELTSGTLYNVIAKMIELDE